MMRTPHYRREAFGRQEAASDMARVALHVAGRS